MTGLTATDWRPEPMSERVVVRCYSTFRDAKRAADTLSVARIPRTRVTVVGRGLRWREAFTASRFVKGAVLGGVSLAAAAALILWSLGALDSSFTWFTSLVVGGVLGGVLGCIAGTVAWVLTKRDRSIPETGHVDVDHYDVLVDVSHADRARELLGDSSAD